MKYGQRVRCRNHLAVQKKRRISPSTRDKFIIVAAWAIAIALTLAPWWLPEVGITSVAGVDLPFEDGDKIIGEDTNNLPECE